ncbi:hypothetical protein [Dyadobacter psychrotolerans]|uniref:ELM2 domain-containing protein n=1 Tax=Dyadobacter psychrotolerans TaxID=2541721 RepID=A0A4R5DFN4_9BACT|nr:hypothetical protein [Dyadobacter psychrotolerans]TDE10770.1 hypothetical protein E0F88_27235 [Dyadobacter psychrotolerans]
MKKYKFISILLIFFSSTLHAQVADSTINKVTSEGLANYVQSFFSIKSILESVENSFINTVKKEKRDMIITQTEFLRRDMVSLMNKKLELFNCAYQGNCVNIYEIVSLMNGSFYQLNKRLKEINVLCANKYQATTNDVIKNFKTDLDYKERNLDKIMNDLTGKKKYNKEQLKTESEKVITATQQCINDIDKIIDRMKAIK